MHVLFYEPVYWGGHHFMYVRQFARTLVQWPVRLSVATGKGGDASEMYASQLKPFGDRIELHPIVPNAGKGDDWGRHYYEHLVDCIDALRPDHVFIPTADIIAAYAGSRRLRGSLRLPRHQPDVEGNAISSFYKSDIPAGEKLRRLKSSIYVSNAPWNRLLTNDPFVTAGHAPWRWLHRMLPETVPDPLDTPLTATKREARRALGLPDGGLIVGCVGHFASHERKNPQGLIDGFLKSGLQKDGVVALLGQMSDAVLNHVAGLGADRSRVVLVNRFLTDDELQLAVIALDVVCLPYRDFYHPSAIVLYSCALGRPVLASNTGWFQSIIPRFKLGWTVDLTTTDNISAALRDHRQAWEAFSPSVESRALAAFLRWENYGAVFGRCLRRRLGLPDDEREISWSSVTKRLDSSASQANGNTAPAK
jgi:glycosyltransferase involved in cell wall biosynthesis